MDYAQRFVPLGLKRKSKFSGVHADEEGNALHQSKKTRQSQLTTIPPKPANMMSSFVDRPEPKAHFTREIAHQPHHNPQETTNDRTYRKKGAFETLLEMEATPGTPIQTLLAEFRKERARIRDLYQLNLSQSDKEAEIEYLKNQTQAMEVKAARMKAQLNADLAIRMGSRAQTMEAEAAKVRAQLDASLASKMKKL